MKFILDEYLKQEEERKIEREIEEEEMAEYFELIGMIDEILHEDAGDRV